MQIKELFTRERHNDGIKVNIHDEADNVVGWIQVRGLDSDAYRSAHDATNRAMVRLAAAVRAKSEVQLPAETQAEKDDALLAERAALVSAWSFDEPCTVDNVTTLLKEAPYISDQIYYTALNRDNFLGKDSPNSSNGPNINSDSTDLQRPTQDKPLPSP